jgi:HD domain
MLNAVMTQNFPTLSTAYQFLRELDAPEHLILHVQLVGEAAELLIAKLQSLRISVDEQWVRLGVAFHDVGKILHPEELQVKGNRHETAGEQLLLDRGVSSNLARCCRSHGQWQTMDCSLEELLVALADKLWKGQRVSLLEELVLTRLAALSDRNYWELFLEMDACFETIADGGIDRLLRSQISPH